MKKIVAFAGLGLLATGAFAQTNLQLFYDFGENRKHVTSTLEMFKSDNWGNTFFFVDYDYNYEMQDSKGNDFIVSPSGTYMEIARCFNFWGDTEFAPFSLQLEYNGGFGGGLGSSYPVASAWLAGVDYFMHSADFSNTLNLKVLYKKFKKDSESIPLQFTAVWGMNNLFGVQGLKFSGFADFWGQKGADTDWVFLSEPQLWYNIGQVFDCPNLHVGGEVELGYNFTGNAEMEKLIVNPCLGVKWDF